METISLASGAAYFNTPAVASQAAISAIQQHHTFYGQTAGTAGLRRVIAQRYQQYNYTAVSFDQIMITPGTKQALYNILHTILKPGDEVIIPAPNWFGLHQVLKQVQAKLILIPTTPADNYAIRPETLKQYITPRTRLFLFSNPCNPTGRIYNAPEIKSWLAVLAQFPPIYILADEIYDLVTYGERVPSLTEFPDPHQQHIVVNGFSKAFAMSGWRIGYLFTPPRLYQACVDFQQATFSGVSEFVQAAALAVMQQPKLVLAPMLKVFGQNKAIISEFLQEQYIPFFPPQGAYYVFPDLSAYLQKHIKTTTELAQYLEEKYALQILPGDLFGAAGYARLSFAIEPEKLPEALRRLNMAFQELSK